MNMLSQREPFRYQGNFLVFQQYTRGNDMQIRRAQPSVYDLLLQLMLVCSSWPGCGLQRTLAFARWPHQPLAACTTISQANRSARQHVLKVCTH